MPSPRSRSKPVRIGVVLLPLGFAAACAVFGRSESTLSDHMQGHYSTVGHVQTALIRGDLEAAREPALRLAEHTTHEDLPQGVRSPVEDMRAFARSVARAATVSEAARCAAEIGAACGRCHEAADAGPTMEIRVMPPHGDEAGLHMMRHVWAADRLWDGLITPSDRLWEAGATALTEDPIFPPGDQRGGQEAPTLARELHDLGTEARRLDNPAHRAGIYGRILGTCAHCHSLIGLGGS